MKNILAFFLQKQYRNPPLAKSLLRLGTDPAPSDPAPFVQRYQNIIRTIWGQCDAPGALSMDYCWHCLPPTALSVGRDIREKTSAVKNSDCAARLGRSLNNIIPGWICNLALKSHNRISPSLTDPARRIFKEVIYVEKPRHLCFFQADNGGWRMIYAKWKQFLIIAWSA